MKIRYEIHPYFGDPITVIGEGLSTNNKVYTISDTVHINSRPPYRYLKWSAPFHAVKQIIAEVVVEV